jgi:hypothetical protein
VQYCSCFVLAVVSVTALTFSRIPMCRSLHQKHHIGDKATMDSESWICWIALHCSLLGFDTNRLFRSWAISMGGRDSAIRYYDELVEIFHKHFVLQLMFPRTPAELKKMTRPEVAQLFPDLLAILDATNWEQFKPGNFLENRLS